MEEIKRKLDQEFQPAGYNVGFNAGPAAGQTVMHFHVHIIPRYAGNMPILVVACEESYLGSSATIRCPRLGPTKT
ncbi:MAG: HIT family protein [Gammaproteobacteria bacterium]|nr:HIT family protein [Gammaproteobacteria bacterium]